MSLDLTKVATQVGSMIARLKAGAAERQNRLQLALGALRSPPLAFDDLKQKIVSSRKATTWLVAGLVAGLVDGLDQRYQAPPVPGEFTIIATDGSHIDIDRHRSTRCCLINIGEVVLRYGKHPEARLDSLPRLYFTDEDLVIPSPTPGERDQPLEGALLGVKRSVEECQGLTRLAAGLPPDGSALALLDGTLILWNLEAYPDFVADALLTKAFLPSLDDLSKRRIPLASYISFPRSTDVVNVIRLVLCPHEVANCDRYCSEKRTRDCDAVAGVQDRDLFSSLLGDGERSALFISPSKVVEKYYGRHQVYFFYARIGEEIARVEVPRWVASDENQLNLVHALILDQCRRGQGYPVALSEAHEKAVISGADREQFWQLVESSLVDERLPALTSAKSFSKRTRWI